MNPTFLRSSRQTKLTEAAAAIRAATRIVLACHLRPDADALGSLLGLGAGLRRIGKAVTLVSPDGVPEMYRFLPGWEQIVPGAMGEWELGIGLDADGSDRLGSAEPLILAQPRVINLDHHTGPDPYGDIQVVDSSTAATGELVYLLLQELEIAPDAEIAACLMAAVLTDTGCFRFSNTTAETFRIAAALREAGATPGAVYDAVYGRRSFGATLLLGRLLTQVSRTEDGRVVWSWVGRADFEACGAKGEATEGFVDQLRIVEGAEVAVFFREATQGDVRVSLRSRGRVNVAQVAAEFGGGGHVPAAGCTVEEPLPSAMNRVIDAVRRALPDAAAPAQP